MLYYQHDRVAWSHVNEHRFRTLTGRSYFLLFPYGNEKESCEEGSQEGSAKAQGRQESRPQASKESCEEALNAFLTSFKILRAHVVGEFFLSSCY